jgi:hypothetical protein
MKGMQGLVVAGLLGVVGIALNWIYLEGKTKDIASISFIGIKSDVTIERGQTIKQEHLEAVNIPERHGRNLKEYVYLWEDRGTVVGITATRLYQAGDLLYRQDYRTPPPELKLVANEKLIWIPVNSNSFVPELVDPGDRIEFIVPVYESQSVPAANEEGLETIEAMRPVRTETIGPFRVGSLGSRLASREVAAGNRIRSSHERLVGIVINTTDPKEMDNASRLQARVLSGDYQNLGVALLEKARS